MAYDGETTLFSRPRRTLSKLVAEHKLLVSLCDAALQEQDNLRVAVFRECKDIKVLTPFEFLTTAGRQRCRSDKEESRMTRALPSLTVEVEIALSSAFADIEKLEVVIKVARANMEELENEIFGYAPQSGDDGILKLRFLSEMLIENDELDAALCAQIIDECAAKLVNNRPIAPFAH